MTDQNKFDAKSGAKPKNERTRRRDRLGSSTSVYLSPGDERFLKMIQEELGVRQSEAIRTAIRVYAALLKK